MLLVTIADVDGSSSAVAAVLHRVTSLIGTPPWSAHLPDDIFLNIGSDDGCAPDHTSVSILADGISERVVIQGGDTPHGCDIGNIYSETDSEEYLQCPESKRKEGGK